MKSQFSYVSRLLAFVMCSFSMGFAAAPVSAQASHLSNGDFDTDVAGWFLNGDEGETLDWDGLMGSPSPGSLRLTAINSNVIGPLALGECIPASPQSAWRLQAAVREAAGSAQLSCGLELFIFAEADCSDDLNVFVSGDAAAGSDWTPLSVDFAMLDGYAALRPALVMGVAQAAQGSCNFDSVRLFGPPNLDIPGLGRAGMLALVGALALVGLILLRLGR